MAKKVVGLEVKVDTPQADASVKSLRAQLKEAQADVVNLSEKFGQTSKEAQEAAKKAASLKDSIGDAKDLVDAFNPDAKFKAFGQAVNGVTGGFAALQGAMGLIGVESEGVEKSLLKVQSALALSQGVDQVLESRDAFKRFGAELQKLPAIQKAITVAQRLWNIAVAANPIGVLVVAITAAIAGITALVSWFSASSSAAKKNAAAVAESTAALENHKRALQESSEAMQSDSEFTIEMAKATGKSKDEVRKLILAEQDKKIALFESALATERLKLKQDEYTLSTLRAADADEEQIKKQEENVKATQDQIKNTTDAVANGYKDRLKISRGFQIEDANESNNAAKKNKEIAKANTDAINAQKDEQLKLAEELRRGRLKEYELEIYDIEAQYAKRLQLAKGNSDLILQVEQSRAEQIGALREKYKIQSDEEAIVTQRAEGLKIGAVTSFTTQYKAATDEQKRIDDENVARKKSNAEAVSQIASNLTQVLGKDTVAGKAVAVAEATINTYLAASKALTGIKKGNPLGAIVAITQAAAVIATGIKSVKAIVATKVPGTSSGSAASIPSVSNITAQVAAPLAPQADTTQLNQASINAVGNASSRAYVLDSDITNNRDRITRLNRAARIN
jgi:hypothetical protein